MPRLPLLLLAAVALTVPAAPASADVRLERLHPAGFYNPVQVTAAPGDRASVFVVGQPGLVWLVRDGVVREYLNQRGRTAFAGERGLLSMAFDPRASAPRRFYVAYVDDDGDLRVDQLSESEPGVVDEGSRREVITIEHSASESHYGGQLQFGPDGLLYLSSGERGEPDAAQSSHDLGGKILRIAPRPGGGYDIPAGNPFADGRGGRPEIWSSGLRNPWRFSFDAANGDLWIGDVGQHRWEEINRSPAPEAGAGVNWGWPCFEGLERYSAEDCDAPAARAPVVAKAARDGFCAIAAGVVVRDPGVPSLHGRLLFGDFCRPTVWSTGPEGDARDEGLGVRYVTGFGEDACGRAYVAGHGGDVHRVQEGAPTPCVEEAPAAEAAAQEETARPPAPGLAVFRTSRQRMKRGQLRLVFRARCAVACAVRATSGVTFPGRRRETALPRRERSLPAEAWRPLRIGAPAPVSRRAHRALRRGRPIRAVIRITATTTAGVSETVWRRVRIVGPRRQR